MSKRSSSKTALIIHKLDSSDNNIGYYDYKGLLSKNNFLGRYLLCKKRKQGKVYLNIYDFKQHKLEQRYDDSSRIYESEIIEDYAAREVNDKIRIYLLKPDKKKLEIKDIQPTNESIKTTVVGEINLEDFNNFPKNIELGKNELIIFNDKEVLVYNLIKKEKVGLNLDEKICNQLYVGEQNES